MKKYVKRICSCIAVILIFAISMQLVSNVVRRKASYTKYQDFFDQEEDFDVLFFGNSHMWNAVYPMDLWNNQGIVSYNMGGPGNTMAINYWMMMNALDYTTPELIVIDCSGIRNKAKVVLNKEHAHHSLDAFPLSSTKIDAINDLFKDSKDKLGFIWNYSIYHNRWTELSQDDFLFEGEKEKGAQTKVGVARPNQYEQITSDKMKISKNYLCMIIEECQNRGIEVLLTYLPFPANDIYHKEANAVNDIAEEYGVAYINFLELDIVNFDTDMYDPNSHLNASGAEKITKYIGEYVVENYEINDQRDNEAYASWNEDYDEYLDYKVKLFENNQELDVYLMMLYDAEFSGIIEIKNKERFLSDENNADLLENINIDLNNLSDSSDNIIYVQSGGDLVEYYYSYDDIQNARFEDCGFSISGENFDVRISLIDNRSGKIVNLFHYNF